MTIWLPEKGYQMELQNERLDLPVHKMYYILELLAKKEGSRSTGYIGEKGGKNTFNGKPTEMILSIAPILVADHIYS